MAMPGYFYDILLGSFFDSDEMEYKICNPESKWFNKFSFHDKLFIISKVFGLFESDEDFEGFEKVVALIDENEFYSTVKKFKGVHYGYDGSDEDMTALWEVVKTILTYSEALSKKLAEQEHKNYSRAASFYFFSTVFHCFSPETVFAANGKLCAKNHWFYDSGEILLQYHEYVADDFKKELKEIYEENREKAYGLVDCFLRRGGRGRKEFFYYLRLYTLCEAMDSVGWEPKHPYPVSVLVIINNAGRIWE